MISRRMPGILNWQLRKELNVRDRGTIARSFFGDGRKMFLGNFIVCVNSSCEILN